MPQNDADEEGDDGKNDQPTPDEFEEHLRSTFGNDCDLVRKIFVVWTAFAALYVEWMTEWTDNSRAYRCKRAVAFLRVACAFSVAMSNLTENRHQSWYVHQAVWVVAVQIAAFGNLWRYSTAALEQRGARLKKIMRNCVSWRPLCKGWTVSIIRDRITGAEIRRKKQRYESSPMLQLMRVIVATEEQWRVQDTSTTLAKSFTHQVSAPARRMVGHAPRAKEWLRRGSVWLVVGLVGADHY